MRIALISICETCSDSEQLPRALLPMANGTLAQYQTALAISAGAEKVVVFVREVAGQVMRLQDYTERAGAQFALIRDVRDIAEHIGTTDSVMVIADGLYVDRQLARTFWAEPGPAIATLSAGSADIRPAGFERIDINHYWAGLAKVQGKDLLTIAALPGDWSMESAILRTAVQQDYPRRMMSERNVADGALQFQLTEGDMATTEKHIVFGQSQDGMTATERYVLIPPARVLAPILWRKSLPPGVLLAMQIVMALLAPVLAYFAGVAFGIALFILGLFTGFVQRRIYRLFEVRTSGGRVALLFWACAAVMIAIGLVQKSPHTGYVAPALMALQATGLYWYFTHRAENMLPRHARIIEDPYFVLAVIAIAGAAGYFQGAILVVGVLLVAILIWQTRASGTKVS